MKLKVFQSSKGDCLMVTGKDDTNIFIDGGLKGSYNKYVSPELKKMRDDGKKLDLVCVSHIDDDHIAGIIQMLDDEAEWRVHEYHKDLPDGIIKFKKKPRAKRPPDISNIWHNAFHDMVEMNQGPIEDMLAASAGFLFGEKDGDLGNLAEQYTFLATSVAQGIELSNRIDEKQLKIPLNVHTGKKLALVERAPSPIKIGKLKIDILAPFKEGLDNLREEWNEWLSESNKRVEELRRKAIGDEGDLLQEDLINLADLSMSSTGKIGHRGSVTPANLASIMFLIKEGSESFLMTGDGHAGDVLKGLEYHKIIKKDKGIHVDVLKVPHHGSEFNTTVDFARRVTADHYVFPGNGAHKNPDLDILEIYVNSRVGDPSKVGDHVEAGREFHFWFNSTSTHPLSTDNYKKHMVNVEKKAAELETRANGLLTCTFYNDRWKDIPP